MSLVFGQLTIKIEVYLIGKRKKINIIIRQMTQHHILRLNKFNGQKQWRKQWSCEGGRLIKGFSEVEIILSKCILSRPFLPYFLHLLSSPFNILFSLCCDFEKSFESIINPFCIVEFLIFPN